jgi:hypothetical protein
MSSDPWAAWREWAQRAAASFNVPAAGAVPGFASVPGFGPMPGFASMPGAASFAPGAASFERFAADARNYLGEIGQAGAGAAADAARRFGDHLRGQLEHALPLWSLFVPSGVGPAQAGTPPAPALGATREHQQRTERMMLAFARAQEAQQRLQRLWSDALREAQAAFSSKLSAEPPPSATVESLRALYDAWIDCAEQAYARIAHGTEFCQALGDLVNSASAWRQEMQSSFELWAKSLDLPTRSELNSLNARLTALESSARAAKSAAPAKRKAKSRSPT